MDISPFLYHFGEWLKQWMSVVADAATVVALIGAFFGWKSFAARRLAAEKAIEQAREERERLWRRVQWAIELSTSGDPVRQVVGLQALNQYASTEWITSEDVELVAALAGAEPFGPSADQIVPETEDLSRQPDKEAAEPEK